MLSHLAGVLVPALVGASLGSFQSADILEKDRNLLGIAGQVEVQEGDTDRLSFPTAEAWYHLGLGFGDFGVKLARGAIRGSLKLPVPIDTDSLKLAIEPAAAIGERLSETNSLRINTLTQGIEVSLLAGYGDFTFSPRGAFTYASTDTGGTGTNTRYREWIVGGTLTRRIKGEKVNWWGELGIYRGDGSTSGINSTGSKAFFLFAPGIGASIEF